MKERRPKNANDYIKEGFPLNIEWDVLYDNSGRDDLVVSTDRGGRVKRGGMHMAHRRRAPGRRQIGVVWGRERAIVRYTGLIAKPLLGW